MLTLLLFNGVSVYVGR